MEVFAKFDEGRGSVTPELLKAIYAKLGSDPPEQQFLESFIESVYAEREAAEKVLADFPKVRGVPVGDGSSDGAKPHRNYRRTEGELQTEFDPDNASTAHQKDSVSMWDIFRATCEKYPEINLYGTRKDNTFSFQTYAEVMQVVSHLASGFVELGLKRQQFVGVMLDTSATWGQVENALWRQAMVPVTLYNTYGVDAMEYIINHAELQYVICAKKNLSTLLTLKPKCPTMKAILFDGTREELEGVPEDVEIILLSDVITKGSANPHDADPPTPEDLSLLIYTSGTTGNPKGVMHRHRGMVAMIASAGSLIPFAAGDTHIAFLPMAHIMEQFVEGIVVSVGGTIGFFSGDVRNLLTDVAILKPTKFIAVPRLLNRLYGTLTATFNALEGPKQAVYRAALASKKHWLAKGCYKSFYDLFVFGKAAAALGGRCSLIATGSAPIDPAMLEFFRIVFSCPVLEGYGMTEVLITNITSPWDVAARSHVGPPSCGVEIKLFDVPEMNYLTSNDPPQGEVCFRGPMNMHGYYKDEEKTNETIDSDGWLHSGDIGQWYPDGSLRLVDRIKHIFKLSQGEYVAPEKLEQLLVHSKYVAQIFVNGNSLQSFLVAIVVPDPDVAAATMKSLEITSMEDLLTDSRFKQLVLQDLENVGKTGGSLGFEIPRAISFCTTPFENLGLLTPTFKMKRNEARNHFKDICEQLFAEVNQ